ncbi:hypothetical protein ACLB2K_052689 [Fragaria x ananassa]
MLKEFGILCNMRRPMLTGVACSIARARCFYETGSTSNDPTTAFINDMFPHDSGVCPERQHIPQAPMQAVPRGVNTAGIAKYNRLIAFQQTPLCPGHEKTVLQCVMEVMHIKVDTKSTVTAVDRSMHADMTAFYSGVKMQTVMTLKAFIVVRYVGPTGLHRGHGLDYYGVLHSVVELVYAEGMKVHLFKCRWFDTGAQSMKMDQYCNLSVNTATSAYEDDPFVFATSVKQVFYLDDLARGDAWKIANIVHPRNIYRAATLGVTIPGPEADAYQEPNAVGIHDVATIRENNVKHGRVLRIRDEDSTFIDVDPNEETDDDSDDELRHRLPDINSDTEEDSSDDSDYEP